LEPSAPVPAVFLSGPEGSGKSTTARMLLRTIEGMAADLQSPPKSEEDLITSVSAGWVSGLDNMSAISGEMSDALCRVVTGTEAPKRALYTDGDLVLRKVMRPLLMTGIEIGAPKSDLNGRMLKLRLERPKVRRSEADLWSRFSEDLPVIL